MSTNPERVPMAIVCALLILGGVAPVAAAEKASVCRRSCVPTILACAEAGAQQAMSRSKAWRICTRETIRACKSAGIVACTVARTAPAFAGIANGVSTSPAPILAPNRRWTWVDFPEARCADGSPTGIGVNWNSTSSKVLIYLQGGGACWDAATCAAGLAVNLDGYRRQDFEDRPPYDALAVFARLVMANPFRQWNFVFVPYCTGDLHSGRQYSILSGRNHLGYVNMAHYLERIGATFPSATQVLVTGSSAGGFGAMFNFHQVRQAFAHVAFVDMLADSAPILDEQYLDPELQTAWRTAWGTDVSLRDVCPTCSDDAFADLLSNLAHVYPGSSFGVLSSMHDATVRKYFGYGTTPPIPLSADEFERGLRHLATVLLQPHPNWGAFLIDDSPAHPLWGTWHVWFLKGPFTTAYSGGVSATEWCRRLVDHDPRWDNAMP